MGHLHVRNEASGFRMKGEGGGKRRPMYLYFITSEELCTQIIQENHN